MAASTGTKASSSPAEVVPPDIPEVGSSQWYPQTQTFMKWAGDVLQAGGGAPGPAGSVLSSWKGVWAPRTSYSPGDIVSYTDKGGAAVWIAVGSPVKGTAPTDGAVWNVMLRAPAAA